MPRPKRPSELNRRVLRRLGRNELAFYRGYLLGLDSLALAHRYLRRRHETEFYAP